MGKSQKCVENRGETVLKLKLTLALETALLMALPSNRVLGDNWEYYLEYKLRTPVVEKEKLYFNFKEETRYKDGSNYYRKSFFGLSKSISSNLDIAFYYAFKQKRSNDWDTGHLFWPEVVYRYPLEPLTIESDTKVERHTTQGFWRAREKLRLIRPLNDRVKVWIGDEVRYFFKEDSWGENEFLLGLDTKFTKNLSLDTFYDYRDIKTTESWDEQIV